MLIRQAPKRCTKCEIILTEDELEQKWCNKCRKNKREENNRNKKNQELRDSAASLFGIRRREQ